MGRLLQLPVHLISLQGHGPHRAARARPRVRPACLKQPLLVGALKQRGLLLLWPWPKGSLHELMCLLVLLPSPNWQQVHLLPVHLASLKLLGLSIQHESSALELQDLALELLSQLPLSILL